MKKLTALLLSLTLTLGLLTGCADKPEQKGELNLFTWENMFPQEVLDGFTKETGIKVNYSSFDTDETMLAKLETAKGGDYDVVVADDYIIEVAIKEGLVQALDKEKIPNFKNINPAYQGLYYDPEDMYTVPYGAGVMTIVYDPEMAGVEIKSFDDLCDPELKESVGLVNSFRAIHGMSLIADGESINTEDQQAIEKANARLLKMAPNIRFIKDDNLQDDIISGEISVGAMFTSQVTLACIANPKLKVVFPEEGVGFGTMAQFIPSNAPHAEEAHLFLDYILRPEVSKQCFQGIGYYCTNQAADAILDEEYKELLTLPEGFDIGTMEAMHNISAEPMELHEKLWTEFRTACGQ